jgi:PAS domain S-box-containing protein
MNSKIKILHLEDSLKDSELIHSLIESGGIGHDYFLADNEKDFINILETENIDIILSDYSLPGCNGNEAIKVAREKYSHIPFIFVSGTIGENAAINAMLNGATDYVLKNKLERLLPAIKRALHEHELVVKRKLTEEALIVSETRYRRLFETAKDGILILDAETGMIKDVNPFLIEMLGYSKEQFIEKTIWEIGYFKDLIANQDKFLELQQQEYVRYENLPLETADGRKINVEFVSNVYPVDCHKVIQCNIRDITERKKAEIILKEKNEELIVAQVRAEGADKLKSAFLANMSHEIRTPVNAIVGFSAFLLQPGLSQEKLEDYVQIINASSLQLLSVISDIIDISKIETGQITIDSELVNINNLLNELLVTYKKIVELKKLSLYYSCDRPNDLIQTYTDGNRIKQVICNLLNNAIKFTTEGKIEFGYKIKGDFIEFYVKDTGIGIAPENHELVFQRFRQVTTTNGLIYEGNGLGLSISKALVEKLGGAITMNSELGAGSIFVFTIPYKNGIVNTVNPLITTVSDKHNWNEKTILVVEDEANNYAYLEELLSVTNIKILHAWDGRQALEQVKNHSDISLVLMDIKMPIMDGYEATRLIKQIKPKLPVIAQTAYALSHDRKNALEVGCDNYISKPINRDLFMEVINNYLA